MKTKLNRRTLIVGAVAVPAAMTMLAKGAPARDLRLWYKGPARAWVEALPIGNGRLGAMVFGRVGQERLQLNEDTLWAGGPYDPNPPEALAALPEVRRLIDEGRFKEANDLAGAKMMAHPLKQMPYGALGDILLTFIDAKKPVSYERELDLATAISRVSYSDGKSRFSREAFVSAIDQVIVVRLTVEGDAALNFDIDYNPPAEADYGTVAYDGSSDQAQTPPIDWLYRETQRPGAAGVNARVTPDGRDALLITGHGIAAEGIAGALTYALRVRVLCEGGSVTYGVDGLKVRQAKSVTLLLAAATSYKAYDDISGDPVAIVRKQMDFAKPYSVLKADHFKAHQALYASVEIDLGATTQSQKPTDQRVAESLDYDDPDLAALYFQYGRYLLLCGSRPGSQPANLQGIWNEGVNPPWGSKYTININTEMNYWPAEPANLAVCVEPLIRMVEEISVRGAETARIMYGAGGWVAHHNTDLWRATAPIDGPWWGLWPTGGAWLCLHLWDHYDYAPDVAYLARIYPILKGASQFFLDTLVADPQGRGLVTSPSLSPEHEHHPGVALCSGAAMDRQILRDLFDVTTMAAQQLGSDDDFCARLRQTRAALAPDLIGANGQLQEWLEDWDIQAPDIHHRHVSHLYAVYPSCQINVRDTPKLIAAAKKSLEIRGDMATGWGTAWRLNLWARMGDGEHAHHILKLLLGSERTYPNMFDAHPPFQIDGNFGGTSGIAEMLMQSWGGDIHILPALPKAWPQGRVNGLRARGGVTIDVAWQAGAMTRLRLVSDQGGTVRLRYQGRTRDVVLKASGSITLTTI